MPMIAQYFAKTGISVDMAQLKKVDRYLALVEAKFRNFHKKQLARNGAFNINFKFNTNRLQFDVQKAFNDVSRRTAFPINRFDVNRQALSASINSAVRTAMAGVNRTLSFNARVNQPRVSGSSGSAQQLTGRHAAFAGGTAGIMGRYGYPSVIAGGALYGIGAVNRMSQEMQANQLALQAAVGSEEGGAKYSEFLDKLGTRLGKTTRTMSPFFAQMLAGSRGTALEPHLETGFSSLMEYSSVMGLDNQKIKGTIRAFTQMIGKQQIMAEELRGQAAEHLPPIVRLMADVAAGGDVKKLNKMMKAGELDPNVHLPLLFERLREESEPLLPKYFKTSRFAQGSMEKAAEDSLKAFATSGGDQGFFNFFMQVKELLKSAEPIFKGLGGAFENLTRVIKPAVDILKQVVSVMTAVSEATGLSEKTLTTFAGLGAIMMTKWGRVAAMFTGLLIVLQDISYGMQGKDSYTKDFMDWANMTSPLEKGLLGVSAALLAIAASLKAVSLASSLPGIPDFLGRKGGADVPGRDPRTWKDVSGGKGGKGFGPGMFATFGLPALVLAGFYGLGEVTGVNDGFASAAQRAQERSQAVYGDPSSAYYKDPKGYDDHERQRALNAMQATTSQNNLTIGDIHVQIDNTGNPWEKPEDTAQIFADKIVNQVKEKLIGDAWQMYPQTQ